MEIERIVQSLTDGALVVVERDGDTTIRPAAFVFVDGDRLSWVEPSYTDPYGAGSPSLHQRTGAITPQGKGLRVEAGVEVVTVVDYIPGLDADMDGGALVEFTAYLKRQGTTWAQERARVRAMFD